MDPKSGLEFPWCDYFKSFTVVKGLENVFGA